MHYRAAYRHVILTAAYRIELRLVSVKTSVLLRDDNRIDWVAVASEKLSRVFKAGSDGRDGGERGDTASEREFQQALPDLPVGCRLQIAQKNDCQVTGGQIVHRSLIPIHPAVPWRPGRVARIREQQPPSDVAERTTVERAHEIEQVLRGRVH